MSGFKLTSVCPSLYSLCRDQEKRNSDNMLLRCAIKESPGCSLNLRGAAFALALFCCVVFCGCSRDVHRVEELPRTPEYAAVAPGTDLAPTMRPYLIKAPIFGQQPSTT